MKTEYNKHPSYATLYIGRSFHGGMKALFGSSIKHSDTITLKISPAYTQRKLNCDRFYADAVPYIEVEMSQAQFAQAITSLNMGEGTPVTLKRLNGDFIEECPFEDKQRQFKKEMIMELGELENKLKSKIKETEEILNNKRTLSKADRDKILLAFSDVQMTLGSNMPFLISQHSRQMEKTVTEAKAEVEAHIQSRLEDMAMRGMMINNTAEQLPPIPEMEKYIIESVEEKNENEW